jgi:hypothetical protein
MHALSVPRATTASVPLVAIAVAATAAIALTTAINRPTVTLTAADGVELTSGISVAPAPGWTVGNQGPGWVTLHNAFSTAIPLAPGNFQQQATVSYNADGSSVSGPLPVQGWFVELLNPSTHQSAFVVFSQNSDAPIRADGDAQAMLDSMQ